MTKIATIILAAGNGTRMKSDKPKVMHTVANVPMLWHVLKAAEAAGSVKNIVIAQGAHEDVKQLAQAFPNTEIALQKSQLGTGDAVKAAQAALTDFDGKVLILSGDSPLITAKTLQKLLASETADIALLGFEPLEAAAYGRLVVLGDEVQEIVEFKDANEAQKEIRLCNSGIYALPAALLFELLAEVKNDNAKGEYYLTDIVKIAAARALKTKFVLAYEEEVLGVNSKAELAVAETAMQVRLCDRALEDGVQMIAPETIFLSADTKFGRDVLLKPNVIIGENVVIGDGVTIGPFAHIRAGTRLEAGAKIGNFVEVKNSTIGRGSKVNHLSYIGDSELGENVNIGAGTITCNYDGVNKYRTEIGDGVFVGSNSALIAPIKLGANSLVAAGSTISSNVDADALAIARAPQKNLQDGAVRVKKKQIKN